MDGGIIAGTFGSPPVEYRPAPFFVFNDEHEGQAGEARITTVLEAYRRLGFGGAFLHPRPGLITEYLSPRWFELIRHAVRECRRLGLVPYLYDENSYPSGVGGGHVPARAPKPGPATWSRFSATSRGRCRTAAGAASLGGRPPGRGDRGGGARAQAGVDRLRHGQHGSHALAWGDGLPQLAQPADDRDLPRDDPPGLPRELASSGPRCRRSSPTSPPAGAGARPVESGPAPDPVPVRRVRAAVRLRSAASSGQRLLRRRRPPGGPLRPLRPDAPPLGRELGAAAGGVVRRARASR